MKSEQGKIMSLIILVSFLLVLAGLSMFVNQEDTKPFSKISLQGNLLCRTSEYLRFLKLDNKNDFATINSKIVRDRFQKHPYVDYVKIDQSGEVLEVEITEKSFDAIVMVDSSQYLITDDCKIIPYLLNTEAVDCPLIINPKLDSEIKVLKPCLRQKDIVAALKIIDVIKNTNKNLFPLVSEIDLRKGKDILITIDNNDYPIIIGRSNLIDKTFYLCNSLAYLTNGSLNKMINYVDMRFNEISVFGINDSLFALKENQI